MGNMCCAGADDGNFTVAMKNKMPKNEMKFTLTYFDGYGRAEPARILLAHANVEYKDDRIPFGTDDWAKLKHSKFQGKSLPIITLANGQQID